MAEFRGKSLRDYYHEVCTELKVTPNSLFGKMLPTATGEMLRDEDLDFAKNYIGDRGMSAVTKVISVGFPQLRVLKLRNNGLRNKSVIELADHLRDHDNIQEIDLSNNYISTGAGKALEKLLQDNERIKVVKIDGTKIDAEIRIKIQDIVRRRQA